MKIKNIRHTGIVVENLEEALWFYTELLGFKETDRGELEQYEVLKLIGIVDSNLTWVKLKVGEDDILELYYIHHKELREQYFKFKSESGFIDFHHVSFTVDNIDELFDILNEEDMTCICQPSIDHQCTHKLFFARDLDGNLLEFVERI